MDQELVAYLDTRFERVEGRLERMESRIDGIEGRLGGVEGRLDGFEGRLGRIEDSVRQTQVMVEGVRDDIRQVAEGVIGTNERMDRVQTELILKIDEVGGLVKAAFTALDSRVRILESWKERTDRDPVEIVRERYGRSRT
jgi:archaellum component FlaC